MTLSEDGRVVSDNFYHRSLEENNYQELRNLPKVDLKSDVVINKEADGNWTATAVIENTTSTPALMIRINVIGGTDGLQFLPIFYSDNYFALLPGEKKEVRFHWKDEDTRGNTPRVVVSGYNVK